MNRITLSKMLVLLRLVIIASLAGYSIPTASAAMHGSWSGIEASQHQDHHATMDVHQDQGDHHSTVDDDQNFSQQECCNAFCVSLAIVVGAEIVGGPRLEVVREYVDDAQLKSEVPPLHRPPIL
jgi:hypothetical protein